MKTTDMTEGSIFKKLIYFSAPMIAGNLLQQVYNLSDTLIVGRCIGEDALASVGSAYTLMIFITSIIIGLCMGNSAFFSMDYGEKNEENLRQDIWHSFWFIFLVSIIIYSHLSRNGEHSETASNTGGVNGNDKRIRYCGIRRNRNLEMHIHCSYRTIMEIRKQILMVIR